MGDLFTPRQLELPNFFATQFDTELMSILNQPENYEYIKNVQLYGTEMISFIKLLFGDAIDFDENKETLNLIAQAIIIVSNKISLADNDTLANLRVSKRLTKIDNFIALELVSGELEIISPKLQKYLQLLTEKDFTALKLLFRILFENGIDLSHFSPLVQDLYQIALKDVFPKWLFIDNIGAYLKLYAKRRRNFFYIGVGANEPSWQRRVLDSYAKDGSRGLTQEESLISRGMHGLLGKVLQNMIYAQLTSNIKLLSRYSLPFQNAANVVEAQVLETERLSGESARESFNKLFEENRTCEDAFLYTVNIITWLIIKNKYTNWVGKFGVKPDFDELMRRDLSVLLCSDSADSDEVCNNNLSIDGFVSWIKSCSNINISGLLEYINRDEWVRLENDLTYLLAGFRDDYKPYDDDQVYLSDTVPSPLIEKAIVETISSWLRINHKNLMLSLTHAFIALTRNAGLEILKRYPDTKFITEFQIPNGPDASPRCDILVLPKDIEVNLDSRTLIQALGNNTVTILEIKLMKSLTVKPPKDHLEQVRGYRRKLEAINPNLQVKFVLLQVSGMGTQFMELTEEQMKDVPIETSHVQEDIEF